MPRIANLQKKHGQLSLIWQPIVDYANGDASEEDFKELVRESFDRMGVSQSPDRRREDGTAEMFDAFKDCKDAKKSTPAKLQEIYRQPIQKLLQWLIARNEFSFAQIHGDSEDAFELYTKVAEFLSKHGHSYQLEYGIEVTIAEEGGIGYLLTRMFSDIGSVVTGICQFILEQIDRHELHGEPISAVFPFGLCERPECGRLFIVQRTGRARFCSDNCRSLVGKAKRPLEEKAAYMRKYRQNLADRAAKRAKAGKKGGK